MKKIDHKYIYILYILAFIILAIILNNAYRFTDSDNNKVSYPNTLSYIANVSELLGLSIALTEIFILSAVTKKIKMEISAFHSYSDISTILIFLSQTKEYLTAYKVGKAILRLEQIKDVYHENLPSKELENMTSVHRRNYDKLNSMLTSLSNLEGMSAAKVKIELDTTDYIEFLTGFNEHLLTLKLTFKKIIL